MEGSFMIASQNRNWRRMQEGEGSSDTILSLSEGVWRQNWENEKVYIQVCTIASCPTKLTESLTNITESS